MLRGDGDGGIRELNHRAPGTEMVAACQPYADDSSGDSSRPLLPSAASVPAQHVSRPVEIGATRTNWAFWTIVQSR